MTTSKKLAMRTRKVMLSGYHGGQICVPVVTVTAIGDTNTAKWHWVDQSIPAGKPGHEYGHGEANGDFWAVVRAMEAVGIRIDDIQG